MRALAFHPIEPVLITASEDHTLKLWNLQKTVPAKKTTSLDVEPLYTFRMHNGPVLSLSINGTGEHCYSGGLDGVIHCWNVPNSNIDPYDLFDPEILNCSLRGHTDAVWGLVVLDSRQQLLSCSADGTVKLWSPHSKVSGDIFVIICRFHLVYSKDLTHLTQAYFCSFSILCLPT